MANIIPNSFRGALFEANHNFKASGGNTFKFSLYTTNPYSVASTVALSELLTGLVLIISGFIKNPFGNILTRLSGLNITILMITILIFAHKDWFFTTKLFTSEQIFLLIGGIYFLIKGNKV